MPNELVKELRGNLSLAEEGLAAATQDKERMLTSYTALVEEALRLTTEIERLNLRVSKLEHELRRASHRFGWLADYHLNAQHSKDAARKLADEMWLAQANEGEPPPAEPGERRPVVNAIGRACKKCDSTSHVTLDCPFVDNAGPRVSRQPTLLDTIERIVASNRTGCGTWATVGEVIRLAQKSPTHSTEDDYQHWLSYSKKRGVPHEADLRLAYYAGADVEPPKEAAEHLHKWREPHDCGDPACVGTERVVCEICGIDKPESTGVCPDGLSVCDQGCEVNCKRAVARDAVKSGGGQ
jgi:hypothetical protein